MNPVEVMQAVAQLKSNPAAMLSRYGVPQNIAGNPQSVIQYMMNSGKITQDQFNAAVKQAQGMGFRI